MLAADAASRAGLQLPALSADTREQLGRILPGFATTTNPVDILYSSFAIHHLDGESQETFLAGARRRISPSGIFLWADILREPGETVDDFRLRYTQRMSNHWGTALEPQQLAHACFHVSNFDLPADREAIGTTARNQGWTLSWIWAGPDKAEALAVLTPA